MATRESTDITSKYYDWHYPNLFLLAQNIAPYQIRYRPLGYSLILVMIIALTRKNIWHVSLKHAISIPQIFLANGWKSVNTIMDQTPWPGLISVAVPFIPNEREDRRIELGKTMLTCFWRWFRACSLCLSYSFLLPSLRSCFEKV